MNNNFLIEPGRIVKKVIITKDNTDYDVMELDCSLVFDNDSEINYIIDRVWNNDSKSYLHCELEKNEYPRGIYEYKDGKYIQIENWDE